MKNSWNSRAARCTRKKRRTQVKDDESEPTGESLSGRLIEQFAEIRQTFFVIKDIGGKVVLNSKDDGKDRQKEKRRRKALGTRRRKDRWVEG